MRDFQGKRLELFQEPDPMLARHQQRMHKVRIFKNFEQREIEGERERESLDRKLNGRWQLRKKLSAVSESEEEERLPAAE